MGGHSTLLRSITPYHSAISCMGLWWCCAVLFFLGSPAISWVGLCWWCCALSHLSLEVLPRVKVDPLVELRPPAPACCPPTAATRGDSGPACGVV